MNLLLLEYKEIPQNQKPLIPMEIWENGVLERTVLDYVWNNGGKDSLFKRGWLPCPVEINFNHPQIVAEMRKLEETNRKLLAGIIRYPPWL